MTTSFNGFGTIFYGKRDFESDDSYVTTKWLIALYLPILPTASLRVRELGGNEYEILDEMPVCGIQVLQTWAYWFGVLPLTLFLCSKMKSDAGSMLLALGALVLPFVLRHFGKKAAGI